MHLGPGLCTSSIQEIKTRPTLIADAGYMYAAKMSGQALEYDLFTPDAGELAFLADENAPHPFYTRGFILHEENKIPELIKRAYTYNNASKNLLVKGKLDYIANRQGTLESIDNPALESLEAIGGTGDMLCGIVSALVALGIKIEISASIAAKVNRWAGYYSHPSPATQVSEIIDYIPKALEKVMKDYSL